MLIGSALLLVVFYLALRFRRRFEEALPPVVLGTMLVLTVLAMFGRLPWFDVLVLAALAFAVVDGVVFALRRRPAPRAVIQGVFRYALTPGFLAFVCLTAFFAYAAQPMTVWWRDDLAHWGLQVKSLWFFQGLVDGASHLNVRFGDYPPGVQVLQWLALHLQGEWSEATLYATLFTTYAVFLLPLFRRLRWKQAYLLPLVLIFCVAFPTFGNVLSYLFLGIDTTLSLCFGYALVLAWNLHREDRFNLTALALALAGLVLVKQIGLILAVFTLAVLWLRAPKRGAGIWAATLTPFAVMGGWFLFCHFRGLSGYNTAGVGDQLAALFAGTYQPPENAAGVLPALLNALQVKYTGDLTFQTQAPLPLPLWVWLALLVLAPLLLALVKAAPRKEMRAAALLTACCSLLFITVIYLSFFTTFYYETDVYTYAQQSNMVLLVERYLAPLILGFGMLSLSLWLDALHSRPRRPALYALALVYTVLMGVSTNGAVMAEVLNPVRYFQNDRSIGSEAVVRDQETWGSDLDEIPGARVLLDLDSTSDYVKELVYAFAPARFFLSTADNTASTEALTAYLTEQGITQLICLDETSALAEIAAPLAGEDGFYAYTLYDVTVDQGTVTLSEH